MLTISASQYAALLNLDFNIGSHTYSLIPKAQIWPRSLNSIFGGDGDTTCLVVISVSNLPLMITTQTGTDFCGGFDFVILPRTFLQCLWHQEWTNRLRYKRPDYHNIQLRAYWIRGSQDRAIGDLRKGRTRCSNRTWRTHGITTVKGVPLGRKDGVSSTWMDRYGNWRQRQNTKMQNKKKSTWPEW
jgi:hypothetical protein